MFYYINRLWMVWKSECLWSACQQRFECAPFSQEKPEVGSLTVIQFFSSLALFFFFNFSIFQILFGPTGTYNVILDESHFKELLMQHVKPPPASSSSECSLIRMGKSQSFLPYLNYLNMLKCVILNWKYNDLIAGSWKRNQISCEFCECFDRHFILFSLHFNEKQSRISPDLVWEMMYFHKLQYINGILLQYL